MVNTSFKRLRPTADEMFSFETEDFLTHVASGLGDVSLPDCLKAQELISAVIPSKFQEYVKSIPNCKRASYLSSKRTLELSMDEIEGFCAGYLYIGPTWYLHTNRMIHACNAVGEDARFAPSSPDEAVEYFSRLFYKNPDNFLDVDYCYSIRTDAGDLRLTVGSNREYLLHPSSEEHLSGTCRILWATLKNGLSIEQINLLARMVCYADDSTNSAWGTDWKFVRKKRQ